MKITIKLFLFILLSGCGSDTIDEDTHKSAVNDSISASSHQEVLQNLNISILMDLSDRINPEKYPDATMEYYLRDVEYIKSVLNGFQAVVSNKKVRMIDDHVSAYFDPHPKSTEIISYLENMKQSFTRESVAKEAVQNVDRVFAENALAIYKQAIKDGKYVGSGTWSFFKNDVERCCIQEPYRNVLVILTDGYIYHTDQKREEGNRTSYVTPKMIRELKLNDSNWKNKMLDQDIGFIPVNADLSGLDVLVLGINPNKKNEYEEDVLKEFWGEWLKQMNVNKCEILLSDLPPNLDRTIQDFIVNP